MEWSKFVEEMFSLIISGGVIWGVKVLTQMSHSMNLLNERMALIAQKVSWHEDALNSHEKRIVYIEKGDKRGSR